MVSINRYQKTCTWIMGGVGAPLCGKPTGWHWIKDEDNNRIRTYDTLCPDHLIIDMLNADKEDEEDNELHSNLVWDNPR